MGAPASEKTDDNAIYHAWKMEHIPKRARHVRAPTNNKKAAA